MTMHILVPVDGSRVSEQALPIARSIARRAGASLHLTHVHVPIWTGYVEGAPVVDQELDAASLANEQTYLELLRQQLAADDVNASYSLLEGPVVAGIVEQAEEVRTW